MLRLFSRSVISSFAAAMLLASAAHAQNSSALINEALDKLVELNLDAPLPQALSTIESKTNVPLHAGRQVYDTLPWGEQTKLTASIKNQTLRQSLAAITAKLGLRFTVGDQAVELEPMAALVRIGRRSTIDELGAIDLLMSTPLKSDATTFKDLATGIDKQLEGMKSPYTLENRAGNLVDIQPLKLQRNATLLDALEEIDKQTRATWYPWGKSIVIIPKEDHVRTLLNRPITVRYSGVDVAQVLTELSRRSGVEFTIEPGAVQRIPTEARTIKLILENVSTRQALESIAGFTGLGYVANENGVYIWNPANSPVARRDRTVGILHLDNGMEIMLLESDIPPDVKQFLESKRAKAVDALREQMKKEGFKPATQPAPGSDL
jgi:hypothetical protein